MITLNILQLLEDNGFGTIAITGNEADADLFFEKLPYDKNGIYIVSRGATLTRGLRSSQAFDLYARGSDDIQGAKKLEDISDYFDSTYGTTCNLPTVPDLSEKEYRKVQIVPTATVSNIGQDAQGRVIYSTSALVTFSK